MLPPLYAILDIELCASRGLAPLQLAEIWLNAGVRLLQLRAKAQPSGEFLKLAVAIGDRARQAGATFIVNDRADIAAVSGAGGVHLGQEDLTPDDVRPLLPFPAVVGLSTHNRAQLEAAATQPVDYIAMGPVYATNSKANPDPVVGIDGVREAVEIARGIPVVAIGGITLERVSDVLAAGAASVAVISDLLVGDPIARIARFLQATRR